MKKPAPKAHALFSPSSAKRWLACAGSVSLSKLAPPEKESPAAQEGTDAHACVEAFLKAGPEKQLSTFAALRKSYPLEMISHAEQAATTIWAHRPRGAEVLSESKSECHFIHPEFGGTADALLVEHFGELFVIDFKYGRMPVEVADNTQLIAYALGIAHRYGYNFEEVTIMVIQPRAEHEAGPVRKWTYSMEELMGWIPIFKKGIKAALSKDAELKGGEHCIFCPAKTICMEYNPKVHNRAMRARFIKPKTSQEIDAELAVAFPVEPWEKDAPTPKALNKGISRRR